ncbi:MAG TPA: hypothetical protein VD999_01575 [Vitreimonas sp.]|nr:hypothetical protein [Vitreimonas sp.]
MGKQVEKNTRRDIAYAVGGVGLMVGVPLIGIAISEQDVHKEYGHVSQQTIEAELSKSPYLTQIEKDFIRDYVRPYLKNQNVKEIANVIQSCKETYGPDARLVFMGIPLYDKTGKMVAFLPKGMRCGITYERTRLTGDYTVKVPSFHNQLLALANGDSLNTLAASEPMASGEVQPSYFDEEYINTTLTNYTVNPMMGEVSSEILLETADGYDDPIYTFLSDEELIRELQALFDKHGVCSFVPPDVAVRRISAEEYLFTYESPNTKEMWEIRICSEQVEGVSDGPTIYDVNALPDEVRRFVESLFDNVQMPLNPAATGRIVVDIKFSGGKERVTLYQKEGPGVISHTLGFNHSQLKGLRPDEGAKIPFTEIVIVLAELVGVSGLLTGLKNMRINHLRAKAKAERDAEQAQREAEAQERKRKRDEELRPIREASSVTTARKAAEEIEEDEPTYFVCQIGNQTFELATFEQDRLGDWIKNLNVSPAVVERVIASRKELAEILNSALQTDDDFSKIQAVLTRAAARVVEENVGGDSIIVSYKIVETGASSKKVLGHLLIDVNLEAKTVVLDFSQGELTIEEQKIQKAEATPFSENVSGEEVQTVKQAADRLVEYMKLQLTKELNVETFNNIRSECRRLAAENATYRDVKEEVIRQLAESIKNSIEAPKGKKGEIEVIAIDAHPEFFVKRIASTLYDYMTDERTGAGAYEEFTTKAVNYLENPAYEILEETAAIFWQTRELNSLMMVQVIEKGKRKIKILFTSNKY